MTKMIEDTDLVPETKAVYDHLSEKTNEWQTPIATKEMVKALASEGDTPSRPFPTLLNPKPFQRLRPLKPTFELHGYS